MDPNYRVTVEEVRTILKYIAKGYKLPSVITDTIYKVAKIEVEDAKKVVLIKRDPNIARERMQAVYVKIVNDKTMHIHPTTVTSFGADFDGDSINSQIVCYHNNIVNYLHIKDFDKFYNVKIESEKDREDGVHVLNYKVNDEVYINAIDPNSGKVDKKKITQWSRHENLKMYKISRKAKITQIRNFEPFWVSEDHSLIAYNRTTKSLEKITPTAISDNKSNYFLINKINKNNKSNHSYADFLSLKYKNIMPSEDLIGYMLGSWLGNGYITYSGSGYDRLDVDLTQTILDSFSRGSHEKHLPSWLINCTKEFILGMFAGYIDTDGTINKDYITIQSASERLIRDFAFILSYKFGIDCSVFNEIKKFTLNENGDKIDQTNNPENWRSYFTLNIKINSLNKEIINNMVDYMVDNEKLNGIKNTLSNVKNSRESKVSFIPYELIDDMSIKERKNKLGLTNDNSYTIRHNDYTQKNVVISDDIIDNSNLNETTKALLKLQNNNLIEMIPCEYISIELDNNETIGYDFTVEDYYTFSTADGIFVQDTMAVYLPISEESQKEAREKMICSTRNDTINSPNFELTKEMLTGIYTLTYLSTKDVPKKLMNVADVLKLEIDQPVEVYFRGKKEITTAGRVIFNSYLPSYIEYINEPVDKKKLKNIFGRIISRNREEFNIVLDKLMKLSFKYCTMYPLSLSLESLEDLPPVLLNLKQQLGKEKDIAKQQDIIDKMNSELMNHLKEKNPSLYIQISSGASRGSDQLRQIMISKGLLIDPSGNPVTITDSMAEGYSPESYFNASPSSRTGIISRALNTASGGYEYRKMVFCIGDVVSDINNGDCLTKRTLNIKLTPQLFDRMKGRYVQDTRTMTTKLIDKSMIGKIINLRSPIYCKSKAICRTCYGDLIYQLKSRNIGIIAAQETFSLSERIMKLFHTGGGITVKRCNIISEMMKTVEDSDESIIRRFFVQKENDLFSTNHSGCVIKINKNLYKDDYRIVKKDGYYILPVGVFNLSFMNYNVKVGISQEIKIHIPEQYSDKNNEIILIYPPNYKVMTAEPVIPNIVKTIGKVDQLLGGKVPVESPENMFLTLYNLLHPTGDWDSVHLEVAISNFLRSKKNPQFPARLKEPFDYVHSSVKSLPSLISWPLGVAFESMGKALIYGMISDRAEPSPVEKLFLGESLF